MALQQQIFQPRAWFTSQSASATCGEDGKVVITANFTNTEPAGDQNAMNVTVKDSQTGGEANIGKVNPGETKTATITTSLSSIQSGSVIFTLTWSDGHSGTDTRTASYPAVAECVQATPTPEPTPIVTPTEIPVASLTPTPELTAAPTETPAPTEEITQSTPTPTETVIAQGPSSSPTETPLDAGAEAQANSPTTEPTLPPTGPSQNIVNAGIIGIIFIVLGALLLLVF